MSDALQESELKLFVDSVRRYFQVITKQEPQITSAFLATGDIEAHDFNGIVSFSGTYNGHVMVSMPAQLLRELLLLQGETDLSDGNLLDAVGEVANTLGGNARKTLGAGLQISVPLKLQGAAGIKTRVRKHPYVITLRWNRQPALVCVDMEKRH
jgi:chemotaxis protein CheX